MNMDKEILQVNIDDIIPNRFQPRLSFDEQGLKELAASIKEHGIIQPLVLRKLGNKYEIIAGERRYKASQLAGLTTVPAVISNIDDNRSAEVALVENLQRRNLTPIEEARSYKNLLDKGYLTQESLAKKMGLSQSAISNKLRLLNLDESVQQALLEERISERHARALLQLQNKADQKNFLERVISERMTVRQLDNEIKKFLSGNDTDIPKVELNPNIDNIKNNASDINPTQKMTVESMMVPDSVLTDYSSNSSTQPSTTNKFFNNVENQSSTSNSKEYNIDSLFQVSNQETAEKESNEQLHNDTLNNPSIISPVTNQPFVGPQTNKFFNIEPQEELLFQEPAKPEILDPMSLVPEIHQEDKISDAKEIINDAIGQLNNLGYKINKTENESLNGVIITLEITK